MEVYIKDGCPYCKQQIEVLERQGISYTVHDVSSKRSALKKVKEDFGADKVPVVVEDGVVKSIGYKGRG